MIVKSCIENVKSSVMIRKNVLKLGMKLWNFLKLEMKLKLDLKLCIPYAA